MSDVSAPASETSRAEASVLATVLESSIDAIVIVDGAGTIWGWNRAAERMFGIPRSVALEEPFENLFPPARRSEAHDLLLNTSPGRTARKTTVALRSDSSRLLVEVACTAVRASEEEPSAFVVVLRDVTDPLLVRSAASAVASGADPSAALESFAQVLGQVIPVDNLTLTAVESGQARRVASGGRCAKNLRSGEILPLDGTALSAAVAGRRPLVCLDTRAGDLPFDQVLAEHGVHSYVVLPLFHGGRVVATLNVGFATAQAPTAGVVQLLGSLGASIMPIVLNLVTLAEQGGAIRRLEQLDDLKNEFLALITHDIRTPLVVIAGFADQLQTRWNELPEGEKLESVDVIVRNARSLHRLVEEGLQVARMESGALAYDLRPVALEGEVKRAVADVGPGIADRIRVSAEHGLPPVYCDPDRHRQILMNLLSNALKFSPPGTPVDIRLRRRGAMVEVAVRDRGPGIARADLPKLFQKFSRVGAPEQLGVPGTGLGLYISKALVEAQGGAIGVRNRRGGGSTFMYTLALAEGANLEWASRLWVFEEPVSVSVGDGLRTTMNVELAEDPLDMRGHRLRRDEERLRDFLLPETVRQQLQDLELARRQARAEGWLRPR